jgi:hypothetical protein
MNLQKKLEANYLEFCLVCYINIFNVFSNEDSFIKYTNLINQLVLYTTSYLLVIL